MGIVWVLGALGCLLVTHLGHRPRVPALLWTAPWVISTVALSFEISSDAERDLMALSSIFMILFYFSSRALGLFFIFEAAGLPLLLSIFLIGRQPQKIEAAKYIILYCVHCASTAIRCSRGTPDDSTDIFCSRFGVGGAVFG